MYIYSLWKLSGGLAPVKLIFVYCKIDFVCTSNSIMRLISILEVLDHVSYIFSLHLYKYLNLIKLNHGFIDSTIFKYQFFLIYKINNLLLSKKQSKERLQNQLVFSLNMFYTSINLYMKYHYAHGNVIYLWIKYHKSLNFARITTMNFQSPSCIENDFFKNWRSIDLPFSTILS